jgi:hypothetical protein
LAGVGEEREGALERARARIERASEQFVADLERLRAEFRLIELDRAEELSREQARLIKKVEAHLESSLDGAEARLRLAAAVAEQEARSRIAEAARTAQFRIELADRAQERELRIRRAVERAERDAAERVRAAERRLLDVLGELHAAEHWRWDIEDRRR